MCTVSFSSSCRRSASSQSKWTLIKITHHHHGAECFNDCIGWLFNIYHLRCIYIRYDVYKNCMTFESLWEMEEQYTHKKYSMKMLNNYFVNYFVIQMWMWYIEKRVCCRWVRSTGRASSIPIPTKLIQHLAHILKGYPIIESLWTMYTFIAMNFNAAYGTLENVAHQTHYTRLNWLKNKMFHMLRIIFLFINNWFFRYSSVRLLVVAFFSCVCLCSRMLSFDGINTQNKR